MATPNGALGTRLYITSTSIADTIDTEREFTAQTWVELGLVESVGEFGLVYDNVPFVVLKDGRTYKLKGASNPGRFEIMLAYDEGDAGQAALKTAANAATQDNYGFRVEFGDKPSSVGGDTTVYFRGLPMSFVMRSGGVNQVLMGAAAIEVNSDEVYGRPAQLYDQFLTGGSLSYYSTYKGSDADAALPVISANTLVCATGNVGTGVAADGSQIIGNTAFTLAGYTLTVIEARIKSNSATGEAIFFGFTDQTAALEIPIESAASSDTITTNATDAVGFMYDTSMATDNIWLVGVNNNVDETAQNSGLAFSANTYRTLRIEIDSVATAAFYIDGVAVGSAMTTCCRDSVNLYPTICASARSTALRTITVDYLYVRQYIIAP